MVVGLIGPALAVIGGTGLAVLLAVMASPAMPIGPVRQVEVSPGFDVDWTVAGTGAALFLVVLMTGAALTLRREQARGRTGGPTVGTTTRSRLASAATFGASLHALVSEPPLYGWNWNAAIVLGSGYDNFNVSRSSAILQHDPRVAAWSGVYFGATTIHGHAVPLLGIDPGARVAPPILEGRAVERPDEIVLGRATATQLGVGMGGQVAFGQGTARHRYRVVGIATFATIGQLHAQHPSLGVGGWVTHDHVPGSDRNILGQRKAHLGPHALFVRFRPGTDVGAELRHLRKTTMPLQGFAGIDVFGVQHPGEIVNSSSLGGAPLLLAGVLALGAMLSLSLALASTVRRQRRQFAVMKAIGLTPSESGRIVVWQATATALVGLVIGLPPTRDSGQAVGDPSKPRTDRAGTRGDVHGWSAARPTAWGRNRPDRRVGRTPPDPPTGARRTPDLIGAGRAPHRVALLRRGRHHRLLPGPSGISPDRTVREPRLPGIDPFLLRHRQRQRAGLLRHARPGSRSLRRGAGRSPPSGHLGRTGPLGSSAGQAR